MNIIERVRGFVQERLEIAKRSAQDWRVCPKCKGRKTCKNGGYHRGPWTLEGRKDVRVQRHWCYTCRASYVEKQAQLVPWGWYATDVRRCAVDQCMHGRTSLRRAAEFVRSLVGRQERWCLWRPGEQRPAEQEECHLSFTTVSNWLDGAGKKAQESVPGQLEGLKISGQMGADGLWVRLRDGSIRVVLTLVDSATGLICGIVVATGEESAAQWEKLFKRAKEMGVALEKVSGLTSDGAQGLLSYLRDAMSWVHHQRCVWHFWRSLAADLAKAAAQAAKDVAEGMAQVAQQTALKQLTALLHAVLDGQSHAQAEEALGKLKAHRYGASLAKKVNEQLDRLLYPLLPCHRGLVRVSPEWFWRDYRLRLSHGRNQATAERLERDALRWAIYHDFTPAQRRSERKRHYKHPGKSPLEVAGGAPGEISYLDALGI